MSVTRPGRRFSRKYGVREIHGLSITGQERRLGTFADIEPPTMAAPVEAGATADSGAAVPVSAGSISRDGARAEPWDRREVACEVRSDTVVCRSGDSGSMTHFGLLILDLMGKPSTPGGTLRTKKDAADEMILADAGEGVARPAWFAEFADTPSGLIGLFRWATFGFFIILATSSGSSTGRFKLIGLESRRDLDLAFLGALSCWAAGDDVGGVGNEDWLPEDVGRQVTSPLASRHSFGAISLVSIRTNDGMGPSFLCLLGRTLGIGWSIRSCSS